MPRITSKSASAGFFSPSGNCATSPFSNGNGRTARLLGLLFLYKYGYDCRGLLNLEEYWRRDLSAFTKHPEDFAKTSILTDWLEYFAKTVETQVEKAAQTVASPRFDLSLSTSFWELNDRQKEILILLEEPDSAVTNKKVQKTFKISQITASRDLAKLATLGLLFPHGKGRSVFYTEGISYFYYRLPILCCYTSVVK